MTNRCSFCPADALFSIKFEYRGITFICEECTRALLKEFEDDGDINNPEYTKMKRMFIKHIASEPLEMRFNKYPNNMSKELH